MQCMAAERFNVFDSSYLSKSGKHTPGVGYHWSGCAGKAKWGLEIGAFSVGRPKKFAGRVDVCNRSAGHFTPCLCKEQGGTAYEGRVWIKSWKRWAKVVIIQQQDGQGKTKTKILASTLETMPGADLYVYYKGRFQSEFLFRDAKQHTGLEHCQSRKQEALDFHFNASMTAISIAKAIHWLHQPIEQRGPFSMADIKTQYFNELLLERFFTAYGLNPHQAKNNHAYKSLYELGKIAA